MVSGQPKWGTPFTADTWFNFAYDIDVSPTNSLRAVYKLIELPVLGWHGRFVGFYRI